MILTILHGPQMRTVTSGENLYMVTISIQIAGYCANMPSCWLWPVWMSLFSTVPTGTSPGKSPTWLSAKSSHKQGLKVSIRRRLPLCLHSVLRREARKPLRRSTEISTNQASIKISFFFGRVNHSSWHILIIFPMSLKTISPFVPVSPPTTAVPHGMTSGDGWKFTLSMVMPKEVQDMNRYR